MGQFSWLYSDINEQVANNRLADTYLLVPEEYHGRYGKYIYEGCYDGYGHFGIYDVFELVAEWNRDYIPEIINKMRKGGWTLEADEYDISELESYYHGNPVDDLRTLGIIMACYDEDNFSLKYPIKITSKKMEYGDAMPSKVDVNQGFIKK